MYILPNSCSLLAHYCCDVACVKGGKHMIMSSCTKAWDCGKKVAIEIEMERIWLKDIANRRLTCLKPNNNGW